VGTTILTAFSISTGYLEAMSFVDLQKHLNDARDSMSSASAAVSMLVQRHSSVMASATNPYEAWLSPSGRDLHNKMASSLSDLTTLLEHAQIALYSVETECFRLGVHVDRLNECEADASRALALVKSTAKRWRVFSTTFQSIITKPTVVGTPNMAERVESLLPKAVKKQLETIVANMEKLKVLVPATASSVATHVMPDFMTHSKLFQYEMKEVDKPDSTSVMLSQSLRAFPPEFRERFRGIVPSMVLPSGGAVGVTIKTFTVHDHKGESDLIDDHGVVLQGYVLGIPASLYNKYLTKPNLFRKLGQFLWADTFRGKGWTKIRQNRLFPYPSPLKKGNYVYLPMLPYDMFQNAFKVRISDWTF
jgi:hypothetical protein